jgi:hypothetical protein
LRPLRKGTNESNKTATGKERDPDLMGKLGKEVKGAVKKAAGEKKGSSGKKGKSSGSSGTKGKSSGGSGADKAKKAARELLK